MSFWQEKLDEYREALESELLMDERNDDMIQLLQNNIEECLSRLS
jgi:hypothetical protein